MSSDMPSASAPAGQRPNWVDATWPARGLAVAGVAIGATALHFGGLPAFSAVLALAAFVAWWWPRPAARNAQAGSEGPSPPPAMLAHESEIIRQVVPVWKRNVEAARAHSERSMEGLIANFASVNTHLEQAMGGSAGSPALEVGAIDRLIGNHKPLLDDLMSATRRSVRLKDEMLEGLMTIASSLDDLVTLSKEVQTISRATHLLALNASVEATRAGDANGGFNVVAQEVRALAAQSRQAGAAIGKRVMHMQERVSALKLHVRREDTSQDEISLQAEESARAMISSVLRSVSEVTRTSRAIRSASRQVQSELENIFMGLQSQDRLSQMLTAVTDDMARFDSVTNGEPDPSARSAREWLDRLEASYTMEELRSSHHDTVAIDRQAAVEFF